MSDDVQGTPVAGTAEAATPVLEPETSTTPESIPDLGADDGTAADELNQDDPGATGEDAGTDDQDTDEEQRKAGLREADYTRKTMRVAETQRAADARLERAGEVAKQAEVVLGAMLEDFNAEFAKVDWDYLAANDAAEYVRLTQLRAAKAQRIQAANFRLGQARQAEAAERQKATQERLAREQELLFDAIPEWKDAERFETESAQVRKYLAKSAGFSVDEANNLTDHRVAVLARKAMELDAIKAKVPKPAPTTKTPPPPTRIPTKAKAPPDPAKMTDDEWYRAERRRENLKQFQQRR